VFSQLRACIQVLLRGRRYQANWLIVAGVCLACWGGLNFRSAQAAVIITAPTVSVPYSASDQTVTAEIYVQTTDGSAPQVGADEIELALPTNSSVVFDSAGPTVSHPYLFGAQSPGMIVDSNVVYGTDFAMSSVPTLADGDGLLLVEFTVKGGTTGDFPLTFATDYPADPLATMLYDQSNDPIPFSVSNGWIDISSPTPVPEPSSLVLAAAASAIAGFFLFRRRRTLNPSL
jgi:hypothetical protein